MKNLGLIYIARNPKNKEDIYKIGKTERTNLSGKRMKELSKPEGVAGRFYAIGSLLVNNVHEAEKLCHQKLKDYKCQNNKEFFQLNIENLSQLLREILSNLIIRDYLPKFKEQDGDKEHLKLNKNTKAYQIFVNKMHTNIATSLVYDPPDEIQFDLGFKILKELDKLGEKEGIQIPYQLSLPWECHAVTSKNIYIFQMLTDHKNFIGLDLLNSVESLDIEEVKKYQPTICDWKLIGEPYTKNIIFSAPKYIEMIIQDDPEYINKTSKTKDKLNEIYNNDKLYQEYTNKTLKDFNNINDRIFYAFFIKIRIQGSLNKYKDEIRIKKNIPPTLLRLSTQYNMTQMKPSTIFFKGSAERIISELSTIIRNDTPDELIKNKK